MIERWHRQLKASIKCHNTEKWTEILPAVLLGLRTCYKEELNCSVAELLYGTTLKLPGEFFIDTPTETAANPSAFVELKEDMRKLRPVSATDHSSADNIVFVHPALNTCAYVFLRYDAVRKLLQPPYTGPHEVIRRVSDKVFTIKVNGKVVNVSVDRLKPAFLPQDEQPQNIPTETRTRSGRISKAPVRFAT